MPNPPASFPLVGIADADEANGVFQGGFGGFGDTADVAGVDGYNWVSVFPSSLARHLP